MSTQRNIQLLLIDPQNDFCDIPDAELPLDPKSVAAGRPTPMTRPALPVAGADADMKRLAVFIDRVGPSLTGIHVTLDSHNPVDIAHPAWWQNAAGDSPPPFTVISSADIDGGIWQARDQRFAAHSRRYVEALEQRGRYLLVIWPEHCLIGSWGNNIHRAVKDALDAWARASLKQVDFIPKGINPTTEHYSAVQAEVPDSDDLSTLPNTRLISVLAAADLVIVAGEALSHCVANTVRDTANLFGEDNIRKLVLLTDCASSVPGFENLGADFVRELKARGMRTALSTELLVQSTAQGNQA
jgi:nicotinamidase/pyrazinamidase